MKCKIKNPSRLKSLRQRKHKKVFTCEYHNGLKMICGTCLHYHHNDGCCHIYPPKPHKLSPKTKKNRFCSAGWWGKSPDITGALINLAV